MEKTFLNQIKILWKVHVKTLNWNLVPNLKEFRMFLKNFLKLAVHELYLIQESSDKTLKAKAKSDSYSVIDGKRDLIFFLK